jgi:hypothetical protein
MRESLDTFVLIKNVIMFHLLRQQLDHDLAWIRKAGLLLKDPYVMHLERIHQDVLTCMTNMKRKLHRQGVKVISQERTPIQFNIVYMERGYQYQHSFRLEPLLAEARLAFEKLLRLGEITSFEIRTHTFPAPVPIQQGGH